MAGEVKRIRAGVVPVSSSLLILSSREPRNGSDRKGVGHEDFMFVRDADAPVSALTASA